MPQPNFKTFNIYKDVDTIVTNQTGEFCGHEFSLVTQLNSDGRKHILCVKSQLSFEEIQASFGLQFMSLKSGKNGYVIFECGENESLLKAKNEQQTNL